jgi:DNA/RNA endonuclease YhcR with UshA esterase domain
MIPRSPPSRQSPVSQFLGGLFTLAAFTLSGVAVHAASITPEEAAAHVGETATVCGLVVSATYAADAPQSPTFLDLGKQYPNQIFTAVIFGGDRPRFGAAETLRGRRVCVTGEIFLYQGTPEIILRDPQQLSGE